VPIDVVPNGIDLAPFRQPLDPHQRTELGFSDEDVLFFYVGRLGPEKNLAFLLHVFAAVVQTYQRVGLVLVGDGPDRENLLSIIQREKMENHVHLIGQIPYVELPRYLAVADAFVTASVTEVHPLTLIEAMAAGVPILGIRSPGVGDIVQNGRNGFLCPSEDPLIFTAMLMRLALDSEQRRLMGEAALVDVEQYSIERTMRLLLDRYQIVLERAMSRRSKRRAGRRSPVDRE
jgi:1,2-diacylglycerol 3-alpha-glucosyltransferase